MPPPPEQALPDDILEEIYLRLPLDEPAWLVRASLASKLWLGLLTGQGFRGRYREFHGAPPMLGFFCSSSPYSGSVPRFVSTVKFGAHVPKDTKSDVLDCRHGRVLLVDKGVEPMAIIVWDPMTGSRSELYYPEGYYYGHTAAVLCAVTGCDHGACHEGPFRVVFAGLKFADGGYIVQAHVSLPELGEWSDSCSCLDLASDAAFIAPKPPVLIKDTLYFMVTYEGGDDDRVGILKYDLSSKCFLSLIDAPPLVESHTAYVSILMGMQDGTLGFAHTDMFTLNLWSTQMGSGVAVWTPRIVIDLEELLPVQYLTHTLRLIGSVEGNDIIFVITDLGIYDINIKSLRWKKIWKRSEKFDVLIPYMSFYNRQERVSASNAVH